MNALETPAITFLEQCRGQIDAVLSQRLTEHNSASPKLQEAMHYSVLGGGKRIRPALCVAASNAVGQTSDVALVPACAIELIHAYSLIHDDLPAMDDDNLRRGQPTVHIAFDEATAILAGDALQTLAFEWLSNAPSISESLRLAMIQELARSSGHQGMVGGQAVDLNSVGKALSISDLEHMHRHKTGALIVAAVRIGALTAPQTSEQQLEALTDYAKALGLAFQVQDDLLDIEGDTAIIGKPQGSDVARGKPTYPALMGADNARRYLSELLHTSLASLEQFGPEADTLRAMANYVVARTH